MRWPSSDNGRCHAKDGKQVASPIANAIGPPRDQGDEPEHQGGLLTFSSQARARVAAHLDRGAPLRGRNELEKARIIIPPATGAEK